MVAWNTILSNTASSGGEGQGGGVYLQQHTSFTHNFLMDNIGASKTSKHGFGGGLYTWGIWRGTIGSNRFINNTAASQGYGHGGGIYSSSGAIYSMTNNLMVGNSASIRGDGVLLDTWSGNYFSVTLMNNTLADSGYLTGSEAILVFDYVTLTLVNNILSGYAEGISITYPMSNNLTIDHNLFWNESDPFIGTHGIVSSPEFLEGHYPSCRSRAIDGGLTIPWINEDLEGNPRPLGRGYDIGALESTCNNLLLPLVLRN